MLLTNDFVDGNYTPALARPLFFIAARRRRWNASTSPKSSLVENVIKSAPISVIADRN